MPDDETEAGHLCEIYDDEEDSRRPDLDDIKDEVERDERRYIRNRKAKTGTEVVCAGPCCDNRFIKKTYHQCFCCTRCKDQFWNRRQYAYGAKVPIVV